MKRGGRFGLVTAAPAPAVPFPRPAWPPRGLERALRVLEGICWRYRTGSPWRDLPAKFVAGRRCGPPFLLVNRRQDEMNAIVVLVDRRVGTGEGARVGLPRVMLRKEAHPTVRSSLVSPWTPQREFHHARFHDSVAKETLTARPLCEQMA